MFISILAWFYTNSLIGVTEESITFYNELKTELKAKGYYPRMFAISGRRWALDNWILTNWGGAAPKSKHLMGQAVDIIVLDVNDDGKSNSMDVDIVYKLLNEKIVSNNGGIGTYKNEKGFLDRQMVHFDCRGYRARWHR